MNKRSLRRSPGGCEHPGLDAAAQFHLEIVGAVEPLERRVLLAAQLVTDLNSVGLPSDPQNLVDVNGTLYFTADDGVHSRELWRSDGTKAGTALVRDIGPGADSNGNFHSSGPGNLINVNGMLFFTAYDGNAGYELRKSDGTEAGTVLVKDIHPGAVSHGNPLSSDPGNLINVNGTLFFTANDGSGGNELWKSDGTEAGTLLVKDIRPGADSDGNPLSSDPNFLISVGGILFFTATDGTSDRELWKSDGTEAGTALVRDIRPGADSDGNPLTSDPGNPINLNGTLYFTADDGSSGRELWKSDGSEAGTVLVKDIRAGADSDGNPLSSDPWNPSNLNGTLFFNAHDGSGGNELWKSDGTDAGTVLVKDIRPGADSDGNPTGSHPRYLTNVNGTLFFIANDGNAGNELWKSDGTDAGTVLVKDIRPGADSDGNPLSSFPGNPINLNGTLFFTANDGSGGNELWKSDGTEAGTVLVKDIRPGADSDGNPLSSDPGIISVGGILFFAATDGTNDRELWKSDGTEAGTVLTKDVRPRSPSSSPSAATDLNGMLFFTADDGVHGRELWKSDGTASRTVRVTDINPGAGSDPSNPVYISGTLFFSADDGAHGRELWKSDGTESGTMLVKDIYPGNYPLGQPHSSSPSLLTDLNGTLFFSANGELWKSVGTATGTVRVTDVDPTGDSEPVNINGMLFFTAYDRNVGFELWKSDGTEAGTVLVKDIDPGSHPGRDYSYANGSYPSHLTPVNGTLFFTASDGNSGTELWKSDGTEAGTVLVKDIDPGSHYGLDYNQVPISIPNGSDPSQLLLIDGTLFFIADDGRHGRELWKSDGTAATTVRVADVAGGRRSSNPTSLCSVNGTLFFSATTPGTGRELWKSDGTAAGTAPVRDINPGTGGSEVSDLINVNGTLYFTANDGTRGIELWKSDGTETGTVLVSEIVPEKEGSSPSGLTDVKGRLFFSADDGLHGRELWTLTPEPFATLAQDGTLSVSGRDSADTFVLTINGAHVEVRRDGALQTFSAADVTRIEIQALGGDDIIDWSGIVIPTHCNAGKGDDLVKAGAGPDTLLGGAGNDRLHGGNGDNVLRGGIGDDFLKSGDGADLLKGEIGYDELRGGDGNDNLSGGASKDRLFGQQGDDLLYGGRNNDALDGGPGLDQLFGQDGNDKLFDRDGGIDIARADDLVDELLGVEIDGP